MNKRIAKKVLSSPRRALRHHRWKLGYGPDDGPWPIETKAMAYLDRRPGNPYNRTKRIVRALGNGPHTPDQVAQLVSLWDANRPFIWHAIRGGQWSWRSKPRHQIPGETIEYGRGVGEQEIAKVTQKGGDLSDFVVGSLAYFADRWCVSRMGRMDAMIDCLRASLETSTR